MYISSNLSNLIFDEHALIRWSAKHGSHPAGDPDLLHYVGELLYKGALFTGITRGIISET